MIASPAAAVVLSFALEPTSRLRSVTFWVEMRESSAERRALDAELKCDVAPADADIATDGSRAQAPSSHGVERIVPAAPAGKP